MKTLIQIFILIFGIILILSTLLQDSKSTGFSSSIMGGAEQLFENRKTNGKQKILSRMTMISSVMVLVLIVVQMLFFK